MTTYSNKYRMSEVKKILRQKKLQSVPENKELIAQEKKPRQSRAKKVPTKEEAMKMMQDTSNELKKIIQDLKDDQLKLASIPLKNVPDLIKETLSNLEEDLEEINENYEQLKLLPEPKSE